MGICSTNRLSFIGAEPEYDLRPGSRFSGLSGLVEYCDILCERALLDDQISSILEDKDDGNDENQSNTSLSVINQNDNNTNKDNTEDKNNLKEKIGASAKDLLEKIKEILSKIGEAIRKAFNNATIKLQELMNADQKFVDMYKKYLIGDGEKNLDGFEGVEEVGPLENIIGEKKYSLPKASDAADEVLAKFTEATNKLQNASAEEANAIVSEYEETLKSITVDSLGKDENNNDEEDNEASIEEILDANMKFGKKGDKGFIPNQSTLNTIADLLSNSKDFITAASTAQKASDNIFKKIEDDAKKVIKESNDDAAKARAKAAYNMCIKSTNKVSKLISQTLKADLKSYRSIRKVWLVCGRYVAAKAGNKE